jgi:uncharacterized protein YaaQ
MTKEQSYSRELIDEKLSRIEEKLDEHGETHRRILEQVLFTNGKVKSITKWLIIVGTATGTILVTNGSEFVNFILKII